MDNLINDKIDLFIMTSMKNHDTERTETLRAMKSAFLNWKTAKENVGKTLDEAVEVQILNKMVKQRQESIEQYNAAGRPELADEEQAQIDIIKEYLPQPATEGEIEECFNSVILNLGLSPTKADMGKIIKVIKASLPNADGKLVASIVQKNIEQ